MSEPLLLVPGDRFIVRMFSPVVTIGGGVVLDIAPPRRDTAERLRALENSTPAEKIALLASESSHGIGIADLVARTGLLETEIERVAATPQLIVLRSPHFWVLDAQWAAKQLDTLHEQLKQFHRRNPLLAGVSKEELRSKLLPGAPPWLMDALLARAKTLAVEGETVRLASHKVAYKQDEQEAAQEVIEDALSAPPDSAVPAPAAASCWESPASKPATGPHACSSCCLRRNAWCA